MTPTARFLSPEERLELAASPEGLERDPEWDWEDAYYFLLGPHFGWDGLETMERQSMRRVIRWYNKIRESSGSPEMMSTREIEVFRAIARAFSPSAFKT